MQNKIISIAPMLDWTDTFFRQMIRCITHHSLLYTEMIAEQALVRGNREQLLKYTPQEHPLALQIGGSTPAFMQECARIASDFGFDEININAGCPSKRVLAGAFGACLMERPQQIAACIDKMRQVTDLPISVKTRISLDTVPDNGYLSLEHFVQILNQSGCSKFIIHARKARLNGMTPKENRQKLPLDYDVVHLLKKQMPHLDIHINGNINDWTAVQTHLQEMDGVMIGRMAYANPFLLSAADRDYYCDSHPIFTPDQVIETMLPLLSTQAQAGLRIQSLTRHMIGLYYGTPKAKRWKQFLLTADIAAIKQWIKENNSNIY